MRETHSRQVGAWQIVLFAYSENVDGPDARIVDLQHAQPHIFVGKRAHGVDLIGRVQFVGAHHDRRLRLFSQIGRQAHGAPPLYRTGAAVGPYEAHVAADRRIPVDIIRRVRMAGDQEVLFGMWPPADSVFADYVADTALYAHGNAILSRS